MAIKLPLWTVRLTAEWTNADASPARFETTYTFIARSSKHALKKGLDILKTLPVVADRDAAHIPLSTNVEILARLCPCCKTLLPAHAANCWLRNHSFAK